MEKKQKYEYVERKVVELDPKWLEFIRGEGKTTSEHY